MRNANHLFSLPQNYDIVSVAFIETTMKVASPSIIYAEKQEEGDDSIKPELELKFLYFSQQSIVKEIWLVDLMVSSKRLQSSQFRLSREFKREEKRYFEF